MLKKLLQKYQAYVKSRRESRIESYSQLIRKLNVHKIERKGSLEFFCQLTEEPEIATRNLLKRFDFSDDNSIVDTKEKELALAGIIGFGEVVVPVLCEYLREGQRIAWPLKALRSLTDSSRVSQELFATLDSEEMAFDIHKVEKSYDILCHLADYEFAGEDKEVQKVAHFLRAKDERVRLAAAELFTLQLIKNDCVEMKGSKKVPRYLGYIEPFVYDESAENTRIRSTVLEAYVHNQWLLRDKDRYNRLSLSGYQIGEEGRIIQVAE